MLRIMIKNPPAVNASPTPNQLAWQISTATLGRFSFNTARRFIYPFAPALSRGLGLPLTAVTSLIAINQAAGITSPFFGPLGDRWGYRAMMLAGLGMLAAGMMAAGLLPFYGVLALAVLLAGLGKSIFDPALQAYVGQNVPYRRRGLAIGVIEFSWAGAALLGIPAAGLLIDRLGWQAPFLALGGLALLSTIALSIVIPAQRPRPAMPGQTVALGQSWRELVRSRAALGALGFGFCTALANDTLFVTYGLWLESSFSLSIVALGTATTAIGLAELLGEGLTASLADRLGLKRAVAGGVALSTLSYALLPLAGRSLPMALGGLFVVFVTFEFSIVTALSLFTEVLAAAGVGRVLGALLGGPLWLAGGLPAVGLVSAGSSALALACLVWGLWRWQEQGRT